MFKRILLPLDGSQLAEVAIPYAEELAGRFGSECVLLHVCAPEHQSFSHMHELYLEGMVTTMRRKAKKKVPAGEECHVRAEMLTGEPADVIRDYVERNNVELVIMSTRGSSGLKVWMLGSVVDKICRAVPVPALLIRAQDGRPVEGKKRLIGRILLPLDGSDASKLAVPYAVELAKKLKASITLFHMAQTPSMPYAAAGMGGIGYSDLGINWAKMKTKVEKQTRGYLIGVETSIRQEGIPVTRTAVFGTDAAYEIIDAGKRVDADLVVMTTHGGSPIARWVFGDVAEKVFREGDLPLLLVRKAPD